MNCSEDIPSVKEDPKKSNEPDLVSEITPELYILSKGTNSPFSFSTNKKWEATLTIEDRGSWISISPKNGNAGDVAINMIVDENLTTNKRKATLTIKTGNTTKTVQISQNGKKIINVTVEIPGTLKQLTSDIIKADNYEPVYKFIVSGKINGDDLHCFKYTSSPYVDLSNSFIVEGGSMLESKTNTFNVPHNSTIETIILPKSLEIIESSGFNGWKKLKTINIPKNVRYVTGESFASCPNLESFTVDPENTEYSELDGVLTNKGKNKLLAFPNAKTKDYTIPSSINSIMGKSFYGCDSLTTIKMHDKITYLGYGIFHHCKELKYIYLGNSVTGIHSAFYNNPKIQEIHIKTLVPPSASAFPYKETITLYVPKGCVEAYQNSESWKGFYQYIEE